jgi:hypothetical protein
MNSRSEQRLTDIDIAKSGNHALVEQQQFDRSSPAGEPPPQVTGIKIERFGPKCSKGRPIVEFQGADQVQRAEPTRIVERKAPALVGLDQDMIVLFDFARIDPPAPGHSKVEHQRIPTIGVDQSIFGAAPQPDDCCARQSLAKIDWERPSKVRPSSLDTCNSSTLKNPGKSADCGFDFRELGHSGDMAE